MLNIGVRDTTVSLACSGASESLSQGKELGSETSELDSLW